MQRIGAIEYIEFYQYHYYFITNELNRNIIRIKPIVCHKELYNVFKIE